MKLKLTVMVPSSMPEDEAELELAMAKGEGITIVTPRMHHMDVDLVDIERGA